MPIGGGVAADAAVIPAAVGVDIGCGMRAATTCWYFLSPDFRQLVVKRRVRETDWFFRAGVAEGRRTDRQRRGRQ